MAPTMKDKVTTARALLVEATEQVPGSELHSVAESKLRRALNELSSAGNPPLKERVDMFTYGAVDLCMEMVRTEGKHLDDTLSSAWWVLGCSISTTNANDKREFESVRIGVNKGLIELAMWEISKQPLRMEGALASHAFTALTTTSGQEEFANRVLQAGAVELCLTLVRNANMGTNTQIAVLDHAIRSLALLARSRPHTLRTNLPIIESISPLLRMLGRRDHAELMMIGILGSRTLIRLVGKDDASRVIRDNDVILDAYADIISKAMASGPCRGFEAYNSNCSLSGFALDLSLISTSDTNKSLLARFIPYVLDMLALYGKDDVDLIHHGLVFLSQVVCNDECRVKLMEGQAKVDTIRAMLRASSTIHVETISFLLNVEKAIFPPSLPLTTGIMTCDECE